MKILVHETKVTCYHIEANSVEEINEKLPIDWHPDHVQLLASKSEVIDASWYAEDEEGTNIG